MISIIVLAMELAILALLKRAGIDARPAALSTVLILVFSVSFYATLQDKKYKIAKRPLFVGYIFRIALLFFDLYGKDIYNLPNSGADSEVFWICAIRYANGGSVSNGGFFAKFMGTMFKYLGDSRLFGQFLLMLCSMVSLLCAFRIFTILNTDDKKVSHAMWVLCLLPNFAILSSIFLRESIVAMFISLSLLEYVKWVKSKNEVFFIFSIAYVFAASRFHSGSIAIAVGYLLSRMVYDKRSERLKITFGSVFATAIMLLASIFVLNRYGDKFLGKFNGLETIDDIANTNATGGASYAKYVGNSNNPLSMVIFTIPRIVFFLLSPLPWMWRGLSDIIAFCFSSCFYLLTMISFFKFLKSKEKKERPVIMTIFIVAMCSAFVFGWGTANSGTACRHREKMEIIWGVLYGLTWLPKKNKFEVSLV